MFARVRSRPVVLVIVYNLCPMHWQCDKTRISCTQTRTVANHTNTPIYTEPKTLKEEFIGPIPDPLLNWVTEMSNVSSTQRWVLLKSLKAASVYQFRVSAVNSVGEGPPSESSNVIRLPQEGKRATLCSSCSDDTIVSDCAY